MKSIKCILLISTCLLLPKESQAEINLTFDVSNFSLSNPTLHTHTPNVELKPISVSNSGVKLAAVCALPNCNGDGSGGFGNNDYDLDTDKLCTDIGYNLKSCPVNQTPKDFCPQDGSYFRACGCGDEFKYSLSSCQSQFPNSVLGTEQCAADGITYSKSCVCDMRTYPYTTANCPTPQVLGGSSCFDSLEKYYIQCTCPTTKNCDLGCKTYHLSPCDSSCKECKSCSPALVPEGYTIYDKSCGMDEIKKTFDDGCETTYYKCEKACTPEVGRIYYSDGTCSVSNDVTKNAIGIVYWVLDNGRKNTFNVMTLDEALPINWSSAIYYCQSYSKHGVTGWKLPEMGELIPMGIERPYGVNNDKYNILNAKLVNTSGMLMTKDSRYWSGSEYYNGAGSVWRLGPEDGHFFGYSKMYGGFVRCILAF